jgi:hypothetical protein
MTMKFVKVTGTAAVLFFGTMIPVYAQRDRQGDNQGDKQEGKQGNPDRPQGRQDKGAQPPQQRAPQADAGSDNRRSHCLTAPIRHAAYFFSHLSIS